jgi:hypothetical protein
MISPFKPWANTIIRLQTTGQLITNSETGNQSPSEIIEEFDAILYQKEKPKTEVRFGQNAEEIYVEGYLVAPMLFPDEIQPPIVCKAIINGIEGQLEIPLLIPSPFEVNRKTGDRIKGYFTKGN